MARKGNHTATPGQRPPRAQHVRWWWMFVIMTGALALAAGTLLSIELHILGWMFAND